MPAGKVSGSDTANDVIEPVRTALDQFLNDRTPQAEEAAAWGGGTIPLRITAYLTTDEPPMEYVSSVRALLLGGDSALVYWDHHDRPQLLPGGRREEGESILQTLQREILEETGIEPLDPIPLGFMNHHHLGPRPDGYAYPYPDFIQPVFRATAGEERPEARLHDPYVTRCAFVPLAEARMLPLRAVDRLFLQAAVEADLQEPRW